MAECMIARGGGRQQDPIPIIPGFCTIVATVRDRNGNIVPNSFVQCKDGATYYNYHTNEKGKVMFTCNSGAANITAYNYSIVDNCKYIDHNSCPTINIDAPQQTSKEIDCNLPGVSSRTFQYPLNNTNVQNPTYFSGNYKFLSSYNIHVECGGGGGGGGCKGLIYVGSYSSWICGTGGGGGSYSETNLSINKNETILLYIGEGGLGGQREGANGGSGGTTSFGTYLSATGGGGGISGAFANTATGYADGGLGGNNGYYGNGGTGATGDASENTARGYNSNDSRWGGGGGGGADFKEFRGIGGSPGGGNGEAEDYYTASSGRTGGGGGGSSVMRGGGNGSNGRIIISFL